MINIGDVETEILINAITTAGGWLATAARAPRGRKAKDLSVARWFETYKLTESPPTLDSISSSDTDRVASVLHGPDIQAALQELLSARLTNAPDNDANRAREAFTLTLALALPGASSFAESLIDFYDDQICSMVARLQASDPAMLTQIRSEALSARMIAVLNAIERHTAALTSAPADADRVLSNYRRQIIEQHGKLQPPDFERRRRVPIEDIYVPAVIYEEASEERTGAPDQQPPSLTVWELATRADRSVLLGDPGGGKTTASNVLMHHFAADSTQRVPFLVTLRDFAASDPPERSVVGHIEHVLETLYQCPAPPGLVNMLLLTGRAIVFFDGLDELLDTARRSDVATRVERFCTEYPLTPVLVTSRVVGYDQARLDDRQFTTFRLGGFGDEDVANYARKWFALEADAQADEAETFLAESESVPDLRSNPLLLSLMCILYRGEGSLPQNRAEIYEQCATLLFRRWDARRRIHQNLRAGNLIEPALRHLAWWLFTREDTQSAVTERELVNATTEFLHGRGFESSDEARDAAREFIEFCRGRMWVLTDTGTTAIGETLYSFTHRTFLEYFAAAQLAFSSDTPEKLARAIAPHVARGEWEVVSELAVQIKDSTSAEGARRVYETLLDERRRRAPKGRSNVLQFLARTLRSVDPSPQITRRLTRAVTKFLFDGDPKSKMHGLPIACLLANCEACLFVIDEEIIASTEAMISSDSAETHLNGLHFAVFLDTVTHMNANPWPRINNHSRLATFWRKRSAENSKTYTPSLVKAAAHDPAIRIIALQRDIITFDEALAMTGGLQPLVDQFQPRIFWISYGAHLMGTLFSVAHGWPGQSSGILAEQILELDTVGRHLTGILQPPWIDRATDYWDSYQWTEPASQADRSSPIDPTAYLGGAAILLILVETSNARAPDALGSDPSSLGRFSDLYWYIESRQTGSPDSQQLPYLPVPEEFKLLFRDWAARKVNFVRDPSNQR